MSLCADRWRLRGWLGIGGRPPPQSIFMAN